MRLMERITNGTKIEISHTGKTLIGVFGLVELASRLIEPFWRNGWSFKTSAYVLAYLY